MPEGRSGKYEDGWRPPVTAQTDPDRPPFPVIIARKLLRHSHKLDDWEVNDFFFFFEVITVTEGSRLDLENGWKWKGYSLRLAKVRVGPR